MCSLTAGSWSMLVMTSATVALFLQQSGVSLSVSVSVSVSVFVSVGMIGSMRSMCLHVVSGPIQKSLGDAQLHR